MQKRIVEISPEELREDFKLRKHDKVNSVFFDVDKLESLPDEGSKSDFLREKSTKEGGIHGSKATPDNLETLRDRITWKEMRNDFVKAPNSFKEDMISKKDLIEDKAQKLVDKYRVDAYDGEPKPALSTLDMKPIKNDFEEELRSDLGCVNAKIFKRNSEIESNSIANRYRCDIGEGSNPVVTDMAENPVEVAKELKQLEAIYRRFEQAPYFVKDMNLKNQINEKKGFLASEIKDLKGKLLKTDLSKVERKEVNDLVDTLLERKNDAIDKGIKDLQELKKRWKL